MIYTVLKINTDFESTEFLDSKLGLIIFGTPCKDNIIWMAYQIIPNCLLTCLIRLFVMSIYVRDARINRIVVESNYYAVMLLL